MKIMMKIQSMTKIIYRTDGHTWFRRLKSIHVYHTRTHTQFFSPAIPRTSQNSHVISGHTKYQLQFFLKFQTSIFLTIKCVVASSIIKCYYVFILTKGMLSNGGGGSEIIRVKSEKVVRKG